MALIARARKKRKPVAEMNVVPYIDVMLVLLVIFMVTAPMLNQGVKVDLTKVIRAGTEGGKRTQVFIRGDKTVDYGSVMGAMGGLQKAGVGNVGLITEAP